MQQPTGFQTRYPYLPDGRQAIVDADLDMAAVFDDAPDVTARAVERIEGALHEGRVGDADWSARVELLSYPVARVLVSLLADAEPTVPAAYAAAEAATFRDRADAEITNDRYDGTAIDFADGLGVDVAIDEDEPGRYSIAVADYLATTPDDEAWTLGDHPLHDGRVRVEYGELLTILSYAVRATVEAGLPHDVSGTIAETASDEMAMLRDHVRRSGPPATPAVVRPGELPPCLSEALRAVREDRDVPPPLTMALLQCLATAGMPPAAISDLLGGAIPPGRIAHVVDRVAPDAALAVLPPGCEAVDDYGWCDPDEHCESFDHPFDAYADRVNGE